MNKILLLIVALAAAGSITAQNRAIARGAEPGELYITDAWYGVFNPYMPIYYDTLRMAIYRLTENGKKLTIQHDSDYFGNPQNSMTWGYILADATPGTLYTRCSYSKNNYTHTALWVSFDYGKNWTFREENKGSMGYFVENVEGFIYRAGYNGTFKSEDYARTFDLINDKQLNVDECGFEECEFFTLSLRNFYHTYDCFQNYINITIDEEYVGNNTKVNYISFQKGSKKYICTHRWTLRYLY